MRSVFGGAIARPVALVCMLLQTPLALSALGAEGFGFWLALIALFNTLQIADLGLSLSMQNSVSQCLGRDDLNAARCAFLHAFTWLLGVAGLLFVASISLVGLFDWSAIFHLSAPQNIAQARDCLFSVAVFLCANLPLSASQRLAIGLQQSWMASVSALIANVASLGMVALAAWLRLPLFWFITLSFIPQILSNAGLLIYLFRRYRWSPFPVFARVRESRLLRTSALFFLPQLGAALVFSAPPTLLAIFAGAEAVTPFGLALRITSLVSQMAGLVLAPLWPAYAEAYARGDHDWILMTYKRSAIGTIAVAGIASAALAVGGETLIKIWLQTTEGLPSPLLITLLAAWTFLSCVGQAHACLLNGLGQLKGQATYGFSSAIISVVLLVILAPRYDALGAALALLIGYAVVNCPGFLIETTLLLKRLSRRPG